jgi:uncharacterized protein
MQNEFNKVQNNNVWEFWPTIGFSVAIFALYFAATFFVTAGFILFQYSTDPSVDLTQIAQSLTSNGLLISLSVIVSGIVGIGFIVLFIRFRKGISFSDYLALKPLNKKTLFIILGVFAGLFVLSLLIDNIIKVPQDAEFSIQAYMTSVWPPLLWIATVVAAPFFEEIFFRGFLFVGINRSRLGAVGAIIITAVLWAALHTQYSSYGMITILILGLAFGAVRIISGTLWSTLILHSLWNLAAMIGTVLTLK